MLKEPQKVGSLTLLWKSFEGYMHTTTNAYYRYSMKIMSCVFVCFS